MIHFPHAKINLGLSVVSRRPDGFHDIETIFYPVPLYEAIEILHSGEVSLTFSGLPVPGKVEDNLLIRAWHLVKKYRPSLPSLQILLHKAIPMGAGLGGGSSDAARFLLMLNDFLDLHLSPAQLNNLAAQLGSDCAFFLQDKPCYATGRGEILEPVATDLGRYDFLLVHPPVSVSTAWAYSRMKPAPPRFPLKETIQLPPEQWQGKLLNDFEGPVFGAHPELAEIKTQLYEAGALYAAMSGSGSTLFGIFNAGKIPAGALTGNIRQNILRNTPGRPIW